MAERAAIQRAGQVNRGKILALPNVVGVGAGYKISRGQKTDQLCMITLVTRKVPQAALSAQAMVPRQVDGIPTDVIEVGELRALQTRTERWRPAPGGVSIGHYKITAGTLGVLVRDAATGARLILSNNHVLANSNDAAPGDAIIQPGAADGGQVGTDTIAQLERFCPIQFTTEPGTCNIAGAYAAFGNAIASLLGSHHRVETIRANPQAANLVDAAVARPLNDADLREDILEIGVVSGTAPAALGMPVRKSGRTTAFTTGEITVVDATVNVSYGVGKIATFENQLVAGPMSQGGDSGSLVVDGGSQRAVGLLFAGSDQSTIFNPIQAVLDCLNISI
ncbi:MAG: S1 family peptidase [Chloroflexi bacterium]|nr:S1 family peptidase [Chloroflexota bacterium]